MAIRDGLFTTKDEQFEFGFLQDGDVCRSETSAPLPLSLRLLFEAIGFKYCGENDHVRKYIADEKGTSHIIKINIEHLTGKRRNL